MSHTTTDTVLNSLLQIFYNVYNDLYTLQQKAPLTMKHGEYREYCSQKESLKNTLHGVRKAIEMHKEKKLEDAIAMEEMQAIA